MSDYPVFWIVVLGGLGTYLIRVSFLFILGNRVVSPMISNVLRYIPPAAFAALVFPAILRPEGVLEIGIDNLRLLAALIALAIGLATRNVVWVLVSGMLSLWTLTYVFG
jgi:branched-subunit amino acid transport protein